MAWKRLLTEDDIAGLADPTATIGGAAVNGVATTAMRSDAAPALGPLTRDLDFGAFKGVNAADPTGAQHLATKAYVDAVAQGLAPKDSVRLATAAALPAHGRVGSTLTASGNGALSVDGVNVANGDRILVKSEGASHLEHGIYVVTDKGSAGTPWVLDRTGDADSEGDLLGASVFVQEGGANADTLWVMTTDGPIVVNTTPLAWTQFASAGDIVAGAGLTKTGTTLDVNVDGSTLEINADAVRVKALGITDAHVAAANKDGAVGTPSLRTLGTGALQAAAGNDGRLSDTRVPAAAAGGTACRSRATSGTTPRTRRPRRARARSRAGSSTTSRSGGPSRSSCPRTGRVHRTRGSASSRSSDRRSSPGTTSSGRARSGRSSPARTS